MSNIVTNFRSRFGNRRKLILFLSTGNTCRAPMAAGYLRKLLRDKKIENVEVRAAGVITVSGLRASSEAVQIMEREGVDLSNHRSSQLSPEVARRADLILGMTPMHVQEALRISKDVRGKAHLLKEYAKSDLKNTQINDPMGCTLEVFKKCFREIRQACERLVQAEIISGVTPKEKPEKRIRPAAEARRAGLVVKLAKAAKSVKKGSGAAPSKRPKSKKASAKKARAKKSGGDKKSSRAQRAALSLRRRVKPSTKLAARKSSKAARGQGKLR